MWSNDLTLASSSSLVCVLMGAPSLVFSSWSTLRVCIWGCTKFQVYGTMNNQRSILFGKKKKKSK